MKEEYNNSKFPNENERYFYISSDGTIQYTIFDSYHIPDKNRILIGNFFKTKEEAEKASEKLKLIEEIRMWRVENDPDSFKLDWQNFQQNKYNIYERRSFYFPPKLEVGGTCSARDFCQIYFSSERTAKDALEHFGDRLNLLLN